MLRERSIRLDIQPYELTPALPTEPADAVGFDNLSRNFVHGSSIIFKITLTGKCIHKDSTTSSLIEHVIQHDRQTGEPTHIIVKVVDNTP
jgi:hypothetical protein